MKNYMTVYMDVHKKSFKVYLLTLLLAPLLFATASMYVHLLGVMLEEENILFHALAVFGFPFFFSIPLLYVNHKVARSYEENYPSKKRPYLLLVTVGYGLNYILMSVLFFIIALILAYIIG